MKDKAGKQELTMNLVVRFERKAPDSVGKWCLRAGRYENAECGGCLVIVLRMLYGFQKEGFRNPEMALKVMWDLLGLRTGMIRNSLRVVGFLS